jgi:hypothetical protein
VGVASEGDDRHHVPRRFGSFLNKLRLSAEGPAFLKLGTRAACDPADLAAWLDRRKRQSTLQRGSDDQVKIDNRS